MGNFVFFLLAFFFIHSAYAQLTDLEYYAYVLPGKNFIVCSDKEYIKSNLIMNEFESDNGYTCLINLKNNGVYRINLKISKIEDNLGMYKDLINKESDPKKTLLDISVGDSLLYKQIDMTLFSDKHSINKQFLIKLEYGKVSFINASGCDVENLTDCSFVEAKNSLFMKKFIKLNFIFKKPNFQEITLLEKSLTSKFTTTEECDPPCINGLCSNGECYCQGGYMGINCSIKLQITQTRISLALLIILLIVSMGLGVFIMWLFYIIFAAIFRDDQIKENSNEVDIMEHWGQSQNQNHA